VHVIDDGSTDDTHAALTPFKDDSRFRYSHQSNQGQARAKNHGIRSARGAFVAFLDADDMWRPAKIEHQLPLFDDPAVGVVYSDQDFMDGNGQLIERPRCTYHQGHVTTPLFVENFVTFNSTVVRRECFETLGVFDETLAMGIDWDLWLRFSTRYRFAYLDERTFQYRVWGGQMSKHFDRRFQCATRIMERFLAAHPGIVASDVVSLAWAHTHTGRGRCFASVGERRKAIVSYIDALRARPFYTPAWRALARLFLVLESRRT